MTTHCIAKLPQTDSEILDEEAIARVIAAIKRNTNIDPEILDEEGVAKLFYVEPRTIRLWRTTRGLPHYKPTPRVILYRRSDVFAWLAKFRRAIA